MNNADRLPTLFEDDPGFLEATDIDTEDADGGDDGKPPVLRSLSLSQDEILTSILTLTGREEFDADITYGNGAFYRRRVPEPRLKFDIDPQAEGVTEASSTDLPLEDGSLGSVVFDPPFLTYVRQGRTGNGKMIMSGRFAGYWRYEELVEHYTKTLDEVSRVLEVGGHLVFKCQDVHHNHMLHATHSFVIQWAYERGLRLEDIFVLGSNHRLPSPNRKGTQRHARIFHSYFLLFKKIKPGLKIGPSF